MHTLWIAAAGGEIEGAAEIAARHPDWPLARCSPQDILGDGAASAGVDDADDEDGVLAILDLRPAAGIDRGLVAGLAARLMERGRLTLVLGEHGGDGTVAATDLGAVCDAALAALRGAGAAPLGRQRWMAAAGRLGWAQTLPDGRIVRANGHFATLLGADGAAAVLGRTLGDLGVSFAGAVSQGGAEGKGAAGARGDAGGQGNGAPAIGGDAGDEGKGDGGDEGEGDGGDEGEGDGGVEGKGDGGDEGKGDGGVEGKGDGGDEGKGDGGDEGEETTAQVTFPDGSRGDLFVARRRLTAAGPPEPHSAPLGFEYVVREPAQVDLRAALAALEERYHRLKREEQTILDSVPAFIWYKDAHNRILRINRYAAQHLGLSADEVVGRATADVYPQDADAYYRDDLDVLATGAPKLEILETLRSPGGEPRFLQTSKVPYFDDSGAVCGVIVLSIDVTGRQEAEKRLRLLEAVAEQSEEGILVASAVAPHAIVYVNPAMERLTGYGSRELVGRSPELLLAPAGGGTREEDLRRLSCAVLNGETFHGEIVHQRKDASEHHLDLRIEPLRGAGGILSHWVALGRDISRQKVAEAEQARLKQTVYRSALEWQQTFDSIAMPVLVLDSRGRVSRLNEAARELAGRSYSECLNQPLGSIGAAEPWASAARLVADTMRRGGAARERRSQRGKTWEIVTHPLSSATGLIVTLHDLSDLVQLQESLRRGATMSAMGFLVAGVAHEVRNPLFGLTALLDSYESQPDLQQPFPAADFRRGLKRLQNLMQQLLDYGQAVPPERSPQALLPTLREAAEACYSLARERRVEIVVAVPADLPLVDMDANRMLQVFQNLLDNALRYSPPDGQVKVVAEVAQGWVECRIEDAGPGIAAEDRVAIFDPFFTRRRGGTGLGLAIVQRIVVEHGGTVFSRERGDAPGTCMVVRLLPAGRAADAVPPLAAAG